MLTKVVKKERMVLAIISHPGSSQEDSYSDALAEMAWSLLVHENPKVGLGYVILIAIVQSPSFLQVKCYAAKVLDILAKDVQDEDSDVLLANKILPGEGVHH